VEDVQPLLLKKWSENSRYRGPDAFGQFHGTVHASLCFAVVAFRLRIVSDHSSDDQPILSQDGRYCMVYNGEVYNALSLAHKKCKSTGSIQTEPQALFALLQEFGQDILPELEGMFALVFIDTLTGNAWAARDHFGIKPLFICRHGSLFMLSSTQDSILHMLGKKNRAWHSGALSHYLNYYYTSGEQTLWQNIYCLPAGSSINLVNGTVSKCAIKQSCVHQRESFNPVKANEMLASSMDAMWPKDASPTLLYSGGLDSGLLFWIALKMLGKKPHLLLLDTGKENTKQARAFAKALQVPLTIVDVYKTSTPEDFQMFLSGIDYPIGDSGFFLHYLACKVARLHSRIVFSGAGADELCGGYRRHKAWYLLRNVPRLSMVSHLLQTIRPFTNIGSMRYLANVLGTKQILRADALTKRIGLESQKVYESRDILTFDLERYLPYNVLALADQACSLTQTEIRLPFLHPKISGYYQSFSTMDKLKGPSKWMIRAQWKALGEVPQTNGKQGFGLPDTQWLSRLTHELLPKEGFYDDPISTSFHALTGKNPFELPVRHRGQHAWAMYILGCYLKRYSEE
jgi:asparagine synthase (glutamine-hydrolysing)